MKLEPTLRWVGAAAVSALMMGVAPAALFAETPADTLVVADAIDDIVSIDPHEAFEFSGVDLNNNTYDGLIELDPTKPGELVPGLAESWSVADDGLTYTFKMQIRHHILIGQPADRRRCGLFAAPGGQAEQDARLHHPAIRFHAGKRR